MPEHHSTTLAPITYTMRIDIEDIQPQNLVTALLECKQDACHYWETTDEKGRVILNFGNGITNETGRLYWYPGTADEQFRVWDDFAVKLGVGPCTELHVFADACRELITNMCCVATCFSRWGHKPLMSVLEPPTEESAPMTLYHFVLTSV